MNTSVAIIGGGIAGLTAAYLLQEKYDVVLFERSGRLGGNAYTLRTPDGEEVDIAVAAYGKNSYKNVFRLFERLQVETISPFGIDPLNTFGLGLGYRDLDTQEGLYLTPGLRGLIAQRFALLKPGHIRSFVDLVGVLRRGRTLLDDGKLEAATIADVLEQVPSLTKEAKLIFLGGLCLISSMYCDDVLDAPAKFFFEKLKVHDDLLPPKAAYAVRFTKQRTKVYVEALSSGYRQKIVLNAAIRTVLRRDNAVVLVMEDGEKRRFDKVVFACNADQALNLLAEPTEREKRLLGAWRYTEGRIAVHSDHSQFPKRELMDGYTFLYREKGRFIDTSISGSLWALPGVAKDCNLISTQHPNFPIDKDRIVFEKVFRTPLFDRDSCATIHDLPSLNGNNHTYYCGSHFGFGVHEDAVTSAISVARMLHVSWP